MRKAAAVSAKDGATILPEPVWARDPLYDIFEHPEVLALLSPRQVLIRTYHLLLNVADMVGRGRRRAETPLEYQTALGFEDAAAREALRQLTWAYVGAMYAGSEAQPPAPDSVRCGLGAGLGGAAQSRMRRRSWRDGRRRTCGRSECGGRRRPYLLIRTQRLGSAPKLSERSEYWVASSCWRRRT